MLRSSGEGTAAGRTDGQSRQREEVLNVTLASCIAARGLAAAPETITRRHEMPDVIATFRGLRCVIEGKSGDVQNARQVVAGDARKRVEQGVAHLAIAVVYPREMRSTPFSRLLAAMNAAVLDFMVYTENGPGDWRAGGVDAILEELRRAHETIVRDDAVTRAVQKLNLGMGVVANALVSSAAVCDRLIEVLGIGEAEEIDASDTD
jgi:hypothetical protein